MITFYKSPKFNIFIATSILFLIPLYIDITLTQVIMLGLQFIILLEIIRTIHEYICKPEHRTKVRYVVDGGIFFGMKELFVGWIMLKTNLELGIIIMCMSILAIGLLIFYRRRVMDESPDILEKIK